MKRLIVNADDFGLSRSVTAGILEAHAARTVSSTSMMVRCAGWEDGVRAARATPALGVGLHFNLLVGAPLTRSPSLTDRRTGRYRPLATLVLRSLAGQLDRDEIGAECEAQLVALLEAGIVVTHIDSHRHTHALPTIHHAVALVAAKRGLPLRRPVESVRWLPGDIPSQLHRAMIASAWRLTSAGVPLTRTTGHFVGVSLQGGRDFTTRFAAVLDALPAGTTELMVHPGHVDDALQAVDAYTWQREHELAALLSPPVVERMRRGDFALIGFGAL
jgi:chitin disaccharide deacetylase